MFFEKYLKFVRASLLWPDFVMKRHEDDRVYLPARLVTQTLRRLLVRRVEWVSVAGGSQPLTYSILDKSAAVVCLLARTHTREIVDLQVVAWRGEKNRREVPHVMSIVLVDSTNFHSFLCRTHVKMSDAAFSLEIPLFLMGRKLEECDQFVSRSRWRHTMPAKFRRMQFNGWVKWKNSQLFVLHMILDEILRFWAHSLIIELRSHAKTAIGLLLINYCELVWKYTFFWF